LTGAVVAALSSLGGVAGVIGIAVVVWRVISVLKKPASTFALYANLGGDPVYTNVAEVSKIFIEFCSSILKRLRLFTLSLPSGERQFGPVRRPE
jgi:hypothetical protein